jgi:hypothetical protein
MAYYHYDNKHIEQKNSTEGFEREKKQHIKVNQSKSQQIFNGNLKI